MILFKSAWAITWSTDQKGATRVDEEKKVSSFLH